MKIYFYLPKESLNEATIYYTDLIEKAVSKNGISVERIDNLNFSFDKKTDYIFVIRIRDYFNTLLKFKSNRIIHWFQGITPEEYSMVNNYSLKAKIISNILCVLEKLILKKAKFIFFVSEKMLEHYQNKYKVKPQNYCVIPCYNKDLYPPYFDSSIKEKSSFVYAGTLFAWQCFEKTVILFKEIEKLNPNATFNILTKEKEEAELILKKYDVKNYNINYVSLKDLEKELSKYKYGFILRDDDVINNVSTPTKMNSYLSVGLIPIYTNVIYSFEENLDLSPYSIKFNMSEPLEEVAKKIQQHDLGEIDYTEYLNICKRNFEGYYDDEYNINIIREKLLSNLK